MEAIPRLSAIPLPWFTGDGRSKTMTFQAGKVGRPLISTSRLEDVGVNMHLMRGPGGSHLMNAATGEGFDLRRVGGMYLLGMWCRVKQNTDSSVGFGRQE